MKEEYKLSHLKELEAESIHIIREVAAEFENPVMLYSIGKDSSVMVRLAEKAFAQLEHSETFISGFQYHAMHHQIG
jgi:sulfate adenylyltransferase subunit 2